MFRAHCPRCQRPLTHCLCALIPQLPSQTRVVVLQHPQEAKHALNTARLATLGLINSEMRCAERFTDLRELLANPEFKSCLLFPGDQSIPVGDFAINSAQRPLQLIVPDGTWRKVRKMLYLNPELASLPRVTLATVTDSRYRLRKASMAGALSTIEAVVQALEEVEGMGRFSQLLVPFDALIEGQIESMGRATYQRNHEKSS